MPRNGLPGHPRAGPRHREIHTAPALFHMRLEVVGTPGLKRDGHRLLRTKNVVAANRCVAGNTGNDLGMRRLSIETEAEGTLVIGSNPEGVFSRYFGNQPRPSAHSKVIASAIKFK